MSRAFLIAGAVLGLVLLCPSISAAQGTVEFGVAAGYSRSSASELREGYNALGTVRILTPVPYTGFRFDALYESTQNLVFGSANVVVSPFQSSAAPYLIGGVGRAVSHVNREVAPNFGAGIAVHVKGYPLFLEARTYGNESRVTTLSVGRRIF